MSLITGDPEDSPRDCSRSSSRRPHQSDRHHHHGHCSRALVAVSSAVASLLSLALILWLTLRPCSPSFSLLAATATVFNASATSTTIVTVDAALTAHNPNAHATALYDQLHATASYAGVPLGGATPLMPPTPLEQPEGDVVLSAMLTSTNSAWTWTWRSPSLLRVRIQGRLRWKVATWVSATHGLTVDCIAAVLLQGPAVVVPPGQQVSFPSQHQQCATHVQ